jgi:FtsP/CotA-like multicopper oxidase with cupredoxin domain
MNRRHFLGLLGAAAGFDATAQQPSPDYTLRIGPVTVEPIKGKTFKTIGYNGAVPGPLIRVPEGKTITIEVINGTDIPELAHWHGLHIPSAVDGAMEEGTPMVNPGQSRSYTFTATPSGTHWYHSHGSAQRNLKRATYTAQSGFFYIEPRHEPGAFDQEIFLYMKEWDAYFTTAGSDSGLEVAYKYNSINGHALGYGEPLRVKEGQRIMLRILNASATMTRRIAIAGHTFTVVAMDGSPLPQPRETPVLELGPAERIDAVVAMSNPGVWILGEADDHERKNGLGIVIEYANKTGEPAWTKPSTQPWSYVDFGNSNPTPEGERIPLVFEKKFAGSRWVDNWTVNGKAFPKTDAIRLKTNQRYRLIFDNRSDEAHPVHLHRHSFEIAKIGNVTTSGVVKDVVVIPAKTPMEVNLLANNPGPTLFHCHQQMHMDYGFMTLFQYD